MSVQEFKPKRTQENLYVPYTRIKHLMGEHSYVICPYLRFNNEPILTRAMLSACIVQDKFAGEDGEGEGGEEEMTGGFFYCYSTAQG